MLRIALFLLTVFLSTAVAQDVHNVEIDFHARIPTRTGLKLSANIYQPTSVSGQLPTLLALTPYGADRMHNEAIWFAQRGYAVVVAECRGRGNSEGTFIPFEYDGKDGYDICKWIERKEWSNGNVGMIGASYLGKVQWLTLRERPAALKTIVPIASGAPGIDIPMVNNIFLTYTVQWLTLTHGRTTNVAAFADLGFWNRVYETAFKHFVPFAELPEVAGIKSNVFDRWLLHPHFDTFYKDILPNALEYRNSEASALTITGYFDDNQRGSLYFHRNLMQWAHDSIRNNSYVVIGPWDHGGSRFPKRQVHNIDFDEAALVDIRQLQLEWFDWKLKGKQAPQFLRGNTMYYEMGTERWLAADSTAAMHDTVQVWHLHPAKGDDNSLYNAGALLTTPAKALSITKIAYNPTDTANVGYRVHDYAMDYSWRDENAASFPEKAVYHSAPLKRDMTICGVPELKAHISLNVPDADFEAILYEIKPDGTCIYLTSDIQRARYRSSLERATLVPRGETLEYIFNTFHTTCRTVKAGSRLRLVFGFLNSPYYQKNYHSGKEVHLETERAARPAEMKIGHGATFPSALILPVKK